MNTAEHFMASEGEAHRGAEVRRKEALERIAELMATRDQAFLAEIEAVLEDFQEAEESTARHAEAA